MCDNLIKYPQRRHVACNKQSGLMVMMIKVMTWGRKGVSMMSLMRRRYFG